MDFFSVAQAPPSPGLGAYLSLIYNTGDDVRLAAQVKCPRLERISGYVDVMDAVSALLRVDSGMSLEPYVAHKGVRTNAAQSTLLSVTDASD